MPVGSLLALCASATFQLACAVRRGQFQPTAVMLLVAAGVLVVAALRARGRIEARWLLAPILVVAAHGVLYWMPLPLARHDATLIALVPELLAVATFSYLVRVSPLVAHVRFAAVLALVVVLGASVIAESPHPPIDVFDLQTQGADDLLAAHDPYATVSVVDTNDPDERVPYTYMPVTLVATTLARAATGDIRWAMIAALLLAGLAARQALRRTAPDAPALLGDATALILFAGPLVGFVIEESWVDVVPLGLVCAAVWALACERTTLAAVLFGFGLAGKQPMVVCMPLLLLVPGIGRRGFIIAAGVAIATVLPFLLWNPSAFSSGTVAYFAHLAPRTDALTLSNLIAMRFHHRPSELYGLVLAVAGVALAWRHVPRGPGTFLLVSCGVLLAFFAFGRLAFANYYFLLAGLAAAGSAASYASESARLPSPSIGEQDPDRR